MPLPEEIEEPPLDVEDVVLVLVVELSVVVPLDVVPVEVVPVVEVPLVDVPDVLDPAVDVPVVDVVVAAVLVEESLEARTVAAEASPKPRPAAATTAAAPVSTVVRLTRWSRSSRFSGVQRFALMSSSCGGLVLDVLNGARRVWQAGEAFLYRA